MRRGKRMADLVAIRADHAPQPAYDKYTQDEQRFFHGVPGTETMVCDSDDHQYGQSLVHIEECHVAVLLAEVDRLTEALRTERFITKPRDPESISVLEAEEYGRDTERARILALLEVLPREGNLVLRKGYRGGCHLGPLTDFHVTKLRGCGCWCGCPSQTRRGSGICFPCEDGRHPAQGTVPAPSLPTRKSAVCTECFRKLWLPVGEVLSRPYVCQSCSWKRAERIRS